MKRNKYIIGFILCCLFFSSTLQAQEDLRIVLDKILKNNPQLKIAEKASERMKMEASIGLLPADPEIEWGYMWADPASNGDKKDFSIRQSFAFPTVYAHRAKYSRLQKTLSDYFYQSAKQQVTAEVVEIMIEIIYHNKLRATLDKRLEDAQKVKRMTDQLLEQGEVGMLDKDKADLQYLNMENKVELCKTDLENLHIELKRLNGNQPVAIMAIDYPSFLNVQNEAELRSLYLEQNAEALIMKGESDLSKEQIKLSSHEYLPEFSVAYAAETVLDDKMRGVKAGISIPLWHKRNTVKLSKIAFEEKEVEVMQFSKDKTAEWTKLWAKYSQYSQRVGATKSLLERIVPNRSLMMAFELGEISLLDYITESTFYYDSYDSFLELEKESFINALELKTVELAR